MELLEIPAKDDPEFEEAISAVVNGADVFRTISGKMINEGADPKQLLEEHREVLAHAELAVLSWLSHLQKRKMN